MRILLGFLTLFFTLITAQAADIELQEDYKAYWGSTSLNPSRSVYVKESSSNGTSDPHLIYLPFDITELATDEANSTSAYSVLGGETLPPIQLPIISSGLSDGMFSDNPCVGIYIKNTTDFTRYVYIAGKMAEEALYKVSGGIFSTFAACIAGTSSGEDHLSMSSHQERVLWLHLGVFCSSGRQCNSTDSFGVASGIEKDLDLYIFGLSSEDYGIATEVTPSNDTISGKGQYFELKLSSLISTYATELDDLTRGDERLHATFDGENNESLFGDGVLMNIAVSYAAPVASSLTLQEAYDAGVDDFVLKFFEDESTLAGTFDVMGLTNGHSYNIGVAAVNKYYFSTRVSPSLAGKPLAIEAFLDEKSCFFLSAGFKTDHYVLDYFRYVRDHFLKKFAWGRAFISFYYAEAPRYAMDIYYSPFWSFCIRSAAYVGYFLLNYGLWFLSFLGLGGVARLFYKSRLKAK